ANVLVVPAAFNLHTGRDHWETLLRARAIENQCYVIAAAQIGGDGPGLPCLGRSMIIDPWGTVLACMPDRTGYILADLDPQRVATLRAGLPAWEHRRTDLYPG
ncbi:nitrilase-related carbon-nitrogen hydrolase, partial [Achromobacter xylosoxidans]